MHVFYITFVLWHKANRSIRQLVGKDSFNILHQTCAVHCRLESLKLIPENPWESFHWWPVRAVSWTVLAAKSLPPTFTWVPELCSWAMVSTTFWCVVRSHLVRWGRTAVGPVKDWPYKCSCTALTERSSLGLLRSKRMRCVRIASICWHCCPHPYRMKHFTHVEWWFILDHPMTSVQLCYVRCIQTNVAIEVVGSRGISVDWFAKTSTFVSCVTHWDKISEWIVLQNHAWRKRESLVTEK